MSTHANAPLSIQGRRRLVERCQTRPIAHVAAEMGISRACASKWVNRYRREGADGLRDAESVPHHQPNRLDEQVVDRILTLRRERKLSARRIRIELELDGHTVSVSTIQRWLARNELNRRRDLDPDGGTTRVPGRIIARWPGHMIHLDVKKVGRIPDGGGWRAHGRGSDAARAADRTKTAAAGGGADPVGGKKRGRAGYVYLHTALDGFSRLAYTEHLPDETAETLIGFWHRARVWLAAHGISRINRVITDNGACYTSKAFARTLHGRIGRHQRIRPYTPRHNGKVERYHRILAEELLYVRTYLSEAERAAAVERWIIHYNYHRPHTACRDQPPASRVRQRVTNLMTQNI